MKEIAVLNALEAHLFDRFLNQTSRTLAEEPPYSYLWQSSIPNFALSRPPEQSCILQLLLSLSAAHAHRLGSCENADSSNEHDYAALSHFYLNRGVLGLSKLVPQLYYTTSTEDSDLRRTIFISSLLICYCTLGQGPAARNGEYLFFSDKGPGQWEPLLKGVKAVMQSTESGFMDLMGSLGVESMSGVQEQLLSESELPKSPKPPPLQSELWKHRLEDLNKLIQEYTSSEMAASELDERQRNWPVEICALHEAYDNLYRHYDAVFPSLRLAKDVHVGDTKDGSGNENGEYANVLGWPFRLPRAVTLLLSSGADSDQISHMHMSTSLRPQGATQRQNLMVLAFLLVAYFCPLLQTLDQEWFVQGWATHVLGGCREALERLACASGWQSYDSNTNTELAVENKGSKHKALVALNMLEWPELMLGVQR